MCLHLTWYNSNTNEFFSPVNTQYLGRDAAAIDQVVILIDDVYDMFCRLQGADDMYSPDVMSKMTGLLAKFSPRAPDLDASESQMLDSRLQLEAVEVALGHLISWRRAEMIQAENIARTLGANFTVLGTKHSRRVLLSLARGWDVPSTYLSHRITEIRRMNKGTNALPEELGTWSPVSDEVNRLHVAFAEAGQLLINPTAIDELRFDDSGSGIDRSPLLAARWPLPSHGEHLLWSDPGAGPEHTALLAGDLPLPDPIASGVTRSLSNRIFFEIAFRDHIIVEHTPGLCVFRPFFCDDFGEAGSEADWSGGVRPEITHWQTKVVAEGSTGRRAAFIHTHLEIAARLRWLREPQRMSDYFIEPARNHLKRILHRENFPSAEVEALFRGEIPGTAVTHLAMNPNAFVRQRARSIIGWVESSAISALHEVFTMLERPPRSRDGAPSAFDVGLLAIQENDERVAADLDALTLTLWSFFAGEQSGDDLSRDFWAVHDEQFVDVFEMTPDLMAFEHLNIPRSELLDLVE